MLDKAFPQQSETTEVVIVRSEKYQVDDRTFKNHVSALGSAITDTGVVGQLKSYYSTASPGLASADGHATLLAIEIIDPESNQYENVKTLVTFIEKQSSQPDFQVSITGQYTSGYDFSKLSQDDLKKGEFQIGLPAALVVLVLVFGALVSALLPLLLALISIFVALGLTALASQQWELSVFILNMLTAMGLALGIDYCLFVISRYREERVAGKSKLDAITATGSTASRAVLFSGSAFFVSMIGLLLVQSTVMRSLAVGAILVSIVSIAAALTMLPALLSLLGDRVNSIRIPYFNRSIYRKAGQEGRFWTAVVGRVSRRPRLSLLLTAGVLIALAIPALDMRIGSSGVSTVPDNHISKQGYLALEKSFPSAGTEPVQVVISGEVNSGATKTSIKKLRRLVAQDANFGSPQLRAAPTENVAVLNIPVSADPVDDSSIHAVKRLRSDYIPQAFTSSDASIKVGGVTAMNIDYFDLMSYWLPIVIVVVLLLTFVLLTVAFRSIVIPIFSILLNLLSVGAAYGLIVAVFQKGIGASLFGFTQVPFIEAWVPLFLFAVLFGLSMDYQVFLLSRIKERYSLKGKTSDAVMFGISSTARIITGAALIIIVVFAGFATGELVMFQQMGFGIGVALLVDATLVRSVMVPAIMQILGKWNWYLPKWLAWLPHLEVEGRKK